MKKAALLLMLLFSMSALADVGASKQAASVAQDHLAQESIDVNKHLAAYTARVATYTEWLVGATIVLAIIAGLQWWNAVFGQRRLERAYGFGGPGPVRRRLLHGIRIRLEFGNYGRTPAFLKEVQWGVSPKAGLPQTPEYPNKLANWMVVLPGQRENTEAVYLCRFDWNEPHVLFAKFTYEDVFGTTRTSALLVDIRISHGHAGEPGGVAHPPVDGYPAYVKWT